MAVKVSPALLPVLFLDPLALHTYPATLPPVGYQQPALFLVRHRSLSLMGSALPWGLISQTGVFRVNQPVNRRAGNYAFPWQLGWQPWSGNQRFPCVLICVPVLFYGFRKLRSAFAYGVFRRTPSQGLHGVFSRTCAYCCKNYPRKAAFMAPKALAARSSAPSAHALAAAMSSAIVRAL